MLIDKGTIFGGDTYSDDLAPNQTDYYEVSLLAGVTYTVDLTRASTEFIYSLVGPQSLVATSGYVNAGQRISYTPTASGNYIFGVEAIDSTASSYTFTANGTQGIDRGTIIAGNTYSYSMNPAQVDLYSANLVAGVTYTLNLTAASTPLYYNVDGPQGDGLLSGTIHAGQQITYTPSVSGLYTLGLDSTGGVAGSYTFTADSSPMSQPPQGSGTSGTSSPPSNTAPTGSPAAGNSNPPPPPPTFSGQDATTGQTLAGYGNSFSDLTPDNLNINTQVSNAFITSGTGSDIINAQGSGTNVLDDTGGTVNFEIGSTVGNNAFFLDASQNPVTWNTIANFHKGDFAVIYGIGPQDLAANAANGLGVSGYSGLTLETYQNGGAAFVTFAGHNSSELGSSLATAFGTDPSGRSFLLVAGT